MGVVSVYIPVRRSLRKMARLRGKTPLYEIGLAPGTGARAPTEEELYEFFLLPRELIQRLVSAAERHEPDDEGANQGDLEPMQWDIGQGGDFHDCIYELFCVYVWGKKPMRYNIDIDKALEWVKNPTETSESRKDIEAMAAREFFKAELCAVISHIIDPNAEMRRGAYSRAAQSEFALKDFEPPLVAGAGKYALRPARFLCTPVTLGGLKVNTPEILDIIMFNLALHFKSYVDVEKKKPRSLAPKERRVGRAEALILMVPENGSISTLGARNQAYYSGPLHTLLRPNTTEIDHLKRFILQTMNYWKKIKNKEESLNKIPVVHKRGLLYEVKSFENEDYIEAIYPGLNTSYRY